MGDFIAALSHSLPDVGDGLLTTVEVTALGAVLALALSFALGLGTGSPWRTLRVPLRAVVEFFRGTSLFVQLFWLFYALPILGYQLTPLACAVVALGLNYGAYGSEVVRGALAAVPRGQWEAAVALNLTGWQRLRLVLLPQAWPQMIPPFTNLLIQLLKSTPLVSLITVGDITFRMQQIRAGTGDTRDAYLLLLVVYFVLAAAATSGMNAAERRAKARLGLGAAAARRPGATALERAASRGAA
jgi:polar amino acid transport system permease protein